MSLLDIIPLPQNISRYYNLDFPQYINVSMTGYDLTKEKENDIIRGGVLDSFNKSPVKHWIIFWYSDTLLAGPMIPKTCF